MIIINNRYLLFDVAIDEYIKYMKFKVKHTTYTSNLYRINNHILPYFKGRNLFSITKKDYLDWQYYIETLNFKYNYKSNLHCIFSNFFKFCILYFDLNENIAKTVGNFKNFEVISNGSILSLSDFNKFISIVDNLIYKTLFDLLFFTGVRKGEALALTWNDIDFKNNCININKTLSKSYINGSHLITTPKTKSSFRKICFDSQLFNELFELREYYLSLYDDFDNDLLVFGGKKIITFTTLDRHKNYYFKKANIKPIKLHEFRHSHACLLFQNNVPIEDVSRRLGHSSISMTMEVYLKYLPINEKRVLETLNSVRSTYF